ncbi:MAG TPA: cobalamin biosynthesis protein CbiD [Desulfobacteraceae bacterium]|nr:cobalamin biosynthesis protein CbiD [Desulfobacteraceae bacterium]
MSEKKKLRSGFTTGAAAAASAKAAVLTLLTCQTPRQVEIRFLTGEAKTIPVKAVTELSTTSAQALVIKDAGDDPDITHKAEIGARVTLKAASPPGITITGGDGVGRVTKPGLEVPVGEPAINSGPKTMIEDAVYGAYQQLCMPFRHQVHVEVFVPKGEELAKKTLNARLGILGGISILGTTGIVRPLSHDAYIATIRSGISVARANGSNSLVFTTGRRSERYAMGLFPGFREDAFIQTGDFFKAGIDMVLAENENPGAPVTQIIYTVFFGKAVKMALGFEHTHAAKSELTLKSLARWADEKTGDKALAQNIRSANTARHAFSFIYPKFPDLLQFVGKKMMAAASGFAGPGVDIRIIILDFEGKVAFDSN